LRFLTLRSLPDFNFQTRRLRRLGVQIWKSDFD
jgi:hypothetical protein